MPRTQVPLAGRTAVITGAGSGIGRALAQRLSAAGCPVAIADQDAVSLADTEASLPGPALARPLDVRDRQAMLTFAAQTDQWSADLGRPIGAVVNNAGVTVAQTVADAALEDDEWVMAVNYGGVVNGTRAFLPILLRQDTGTLVNISSVFGLFGFPNQSAYVASKHAVRGFSESLRQELRGSGVRIAVVHPGGVRTNIVRNARWHVDDTGSSDHGLAMERFAAIARTTPERAAKIIQSGIERGDPRIRIGADAVAMDVLVRVAPVRYFSVIDRLEKMTRPKDLR